MNYVKPCPKCGGKLTKLTSGNYCQTCANLDRTSKTISSHKEWSVAPSHYTDGGIETIDYIRAKLSSEEFGGYCRGNLLKYISRAGKKCEALVDYKKALDYLNWLIESEEKK